MPIASQAGGWPTKHFRVGAQQQNPSKVVVVDRSPGQKGPPPSPGAPPRSPYPPRQPSRPASQPPPYTAYPNQGYNRYPPYQQQPPPSSGCCGRRSGGSGPGGPGNGCCGYDSMYTTGVAGAGAGCCAGGMFGSKSYPFDPNNQYTMKGTGKRRCWACVLAAIFALLLLALLLGLLLGLKPYLEKKERQKQVKNALPGGYYRDGVYYYPITDPPDNFYVVLGPGIPCNAFNNNSDHVASRGGFDSVTQINLGATTAIESLTETFTFIVPTEFPDCNQISSTIVKTDNYTMTNPTVNPLLSTTDTAARHVTGSSLILGLLLCTWVHVMNR